MMEEASLNKSEELCLLRQEADELVKVFTTTKSKMKK